MNYYFILNIKINDMNEYQKYLNEVDQVFSKFKGRYLAVDQGPKIIEGSWDYSRVVIIGFETIEDFNGWYYSDEYQRILKNRLNAAKCDSLVVRGK